jgi:hypothetical protein
MKIRIVTMSLAIFGSLFLFSLNADAASGIAYPSDWKNWESISTTLTKIGALPGCDADVSSLPDIYQETVAVYCSVKAGGPGKVAILVKPSILTVYKTRSGKIADGPSMILHLKDMKLLFVTGYKGGKAKYGVFTEEGKDVTASEGPLSSETCNTCHTGYRAFCTNGQCGRIES